MRHEEDPITSKKVGLRPLAAPDALEFDLPDKHCCLISDDGSHISRELVARLESRGWRVIVLRYFNPHMDYPSLSVAGNNDFGQAPLIAFTADDESYIRQQLDDIVSRFGPVAAFIHVHPQFSPLPESPVIFNTDSEKVLRQVFLTAKFLQPSLTSAAQLPVSGIRACFMTVTQLDGGFGLRGERDIDVIAGGLSGLTKTLALEWPEVFCRVVDVSPDINQDAARYILTELNDPNRRCIEVGWHKSGRVTPEVL